MISPVTIYVPVPAGVANRPGTAEARQPDPVRAVEPIVPGDRRGQPDARLHAFFDDHAAEGLTARRRVRPDRREAPEDGSPGAGDAGDGTAIRPPRNEAATAQAPPPSPPSGRALTAPLDGPDRPLAIDAVYRTIEGFGGDIARRGAIFDFSV